MDKLIFHKSQLKIHIKIRAPQKEAPLSAPDCTAISAER